MLGKLRGSPFAFLNTVNEVMDVQKLAEDSLLVKFKEGESTVGRSKRIPAGVAALRKLQDDVALKLETCGNVHWATDVDIAALSEELNLSFIIAGNRWTNLPADAVETVTGKVLHGYVGVRETPCLWICLYYIDATHFQVLCFETCGECHSWFSPDGIPPSLLAAVAACS
eukprot:s3227_g5.t1